MYNNTPVKKLIARHSIAIPAKSHDGGMPVRDPYKVENKIN